MAYATVEELEAYPVTVPAGVNAELLLTRASRDVDRALLTAIYDVDDDGMPTKPAVREALRTATIEQVAGMLDAGERTGTGAAQPPAGFTIGKLSVQAAGSSGGGQQASKIAGLWPQAWQVLQAAGLTGRGPQTP
ncbi:hypothetical protein ACQSSU_12835 [Micromonospora echinospora]